MRRMNMFVATLLVLSTALLIGFEPAAECRPRTKINPMDGLSYVWIPPGNFLMGCSAGDRSCFAWEPTAHPVAVRKGYWIGATEGDAGGVSPRDRNEPKRSEEHTSELQSPYDLVCRLLLEKKKCTNT